MADVSARAMAAPLRLGLEAHDGRLAVSVLKRRGGELAQPLVLDLAARWSTAPAEALARLAFAPRLPPRPQDPRPAPRSSAGRDGAPAARFARVRHAGAAN